MAMALVDRALQAPEYGDTRQARRRMKSSCWRMPTTSSRRLCLAPQTPPLRRFPGRTELLKRLQQEQNHG